MKKFTNLLLCLVVVACSKKELPDDRSLLGLDYYPLTIGKYVIYNVDSTVYVEIPKDTIQFVYQLREKIIESFQETNGSTAYRLERAVRYPIAGGYTAWHPVENWLIRANQQQIEVQEGSVRFTRLRFPVELNATWNGNAANTKSPQNFYYEYINRTEAINTLNLDNVLKVNEIDNVNLIEAEQSLKKYAKTIGLVNKYYSNIKGNNIVPGKTVFERIESGIIYKQELVEHGIE